MNNFALECQNPENWKVEFLGLEIYISGSVFLKFEIGVDSSFEICQSSDCPVITSMQSPRDSPSGDFFRDKFIIVRRRKYA